jgi:hypothetical protein
VGESWVSCINLPTLAFSSLWILFFTSPPHPQPLNPHNRPTPNPRPLPIHLHTLLLPHHQCPPQLSPSPRSLPPINIISLHIVPLFGLVPSFSILPQHGLRWVWTWCIWGEGCERKMLYDMIDTLEPTVPVQFCNVGHYLKCQVSFCFLYSLFFLPFLIPSSSTKFICIISQQPIPTNHPPTYNYL